MKLKKLSALLAVSTLLATSSAMAWESESGAWSTSASVALGSNYVWRGITQTDDEAAISGSFDVGHSSGLYAGVWASNVDFGDSVSTEIDYYAGFANDIGDTGLSYDVGGLYYQYPDGEDLDFFEVYGSLGYSFLTAGMAYTAAADDSDLEGSIYYSLDASYDVGAITLAAGVGYYDFDDKDWKDYTNYKVGASTELVGFGLDLSYTDTDLNGADTDAITFTISRSM